MEGILREKDCVAQEWCKEEKSVEGRQVSSEPGRDFHTLINTCVEILMEQKHILRASARRLPCGGTTQF